MRTCGAVALGGFLLAVGQRVVVVGAVHLGLAVIIETGFLHQFLELSLLCLCHAFRPLSFVVGQGMNVLCRYS